MAASPSERRRREPFKTHNLKSFPLSLSEGLQDFVAKQPQERVFGLIHLEFRRTVLLSGARQAGEHHVATVAGVNVPPELSVHK